MNYLHHNRVAWNKGSAALAVWSTPVDSATINEAKASRWHIALTPKLPVPPVWFGDIRGKHVLCLASGGGQQAPILAAAGADVVSLDLSDGQLAKDRLVAVRDGLSLRCIQGDMADLTCFAGETFDLIVNPASNVFVPDVRAVWRESHRVLRSGGELLAGFMNPTVFMFDHDEAENTGILHAKYALPYSDLSSLGSRDLQRKIEHGKPLEFSHSLDAQLAGPLEAGFVITGFYEDHWFDDTWAFGNLSPACMATRARKVV